MLKICHLVYFVASDNQLTIKKAWLDSGVFFPILHLFPNDIIGIIPCWAFSIVGKWPLEISSLVI